MTDDTIFQLEINNENKVINEKMNHPTAETLDVCMEKMFKFSIVLNETETNVNKNQNSCGLVNLINYFEVILNFFDNVILPSHNTHHVQFLIFHYCSFKVSFF